MDGPGWPGLGRKEESHRENELARADLDRRGKRRPERSGVAEEVWTVERLEVWRRTCRRMAGMVL